MYKRQAQVGDYILVHAGFGIQIVDEQEAQETLELVNTMAELAEEDVYKRQCRPTRRP